MQKTDAELIAEVEGLDAKAAKGEWTNLDGDQIPEGGYIYRFHPEEGHACVIGAEYGYELNIKDDDWLFVVKARTLLPELARRLKAANERIEQEKQRIEDAKSLFKHVIRELQNSAACLGDYPTGNDCAELSCCGLLCNKLDGNAWECSRCGIIYG